MLAVQLGRGKTIAVLLHQTDGDGLCGFWPYAVRLADHDGIHTVLVDLCGYGQSQCRQGKFYDDQLAQVALAVRWARSLGGTRIVLVGASMGGALALATTPSTHADAVVDLSGPPEWIGDQAAALAARVTVPTLVVSSPGDSSTSFAGIRALFARIPAHTKKFMTGDGSHGWDLLGDYTTQPTTWYPLADTVAHWITGQYA
jgi:dienelactone hydrolase